MWFTILTIFFAIIVSIPLLVIAIELLISVLDRSETIVKSAFHGSCTILIPAHNEAEIINKTLRSLFSESVLPSSILLIADNCTDNTAEIGRNLGCTVLERFDEERRGKGYALDHGISYLKKQSLPDVLIILDADCQITAESLDILAYRTIEDDRPIQALYLMCHGASASLKQRVASFAWLVKNKIRPTAINKLGLPVTLTGTGMAFPWKVIADINIAHGNIVEDMQLGIDCTLMGYPPVFCPQAAVYSNFPEQDEAEKIQRTRWEHGHLMTIVQQVPRLLKQAIVKNDWRLFSLALDISVPPLSLLVLISASSLLLLVTISYFVDSYIALSLLATSFGFFSIMLIATWWHFGRDYLTSNELCHIPIYILSKLPVYVAFIFKRQKDWVRTSRKGKD